MVLCRRPVAGSGARRGAVGADLAAVATILQLPSGGGARETLGRIVRDEGTTDHAPPLLAAHSRYRAARRDFLRFVPALVLATRGGVGCHTSPAPPRA